jgi:hypothetical protein
MRGADDEPYAGKHVRCRLESSDFGGGIVIFGTYGALQATGFVVSEMDN